MSRFARRRQVFFLEEPVLSEVESLLIRPCPLTGVQVVIPMMRTTRPEDRRDVLDLLLARSGPAIAWYAAPEAHGYSHHVRWLSTVYDCAQEPSTEGRPFEDGLLHAADTVFTGTLGLRDDRRARHPNVHFFPDGIDVVQLGAARSGLPEPADQIGLRRPLIGRAGVVDDRVDFDLLARTAALRPHWQFCLIGAIETDRDLPRAGNIHWLGARKEAELPAYMSHWDAAFMPLRREAVPDSAEAPRYLAAGLRVVATPMREMSRRFPIETVLTAGTPGEMVLAAEQAMARTDITDFLAADDLLATLSWDAIQSHMAALITMAERKAGGPLPQAEPAWLS